MTNSLQIPLRSIQAGLIAFALLACLQSASLVHAAPGDVDPLDAGLVGSSVFATAVQPDGKIIIGGNFTAVQGQPRNNIARLHANGVIDAGFNPDANGVVNCVAVQADGGILLGGSFTSVGGTGRNRIARVDAAGALDAGFNPDANDTVFCVAVQADGRILLGGAFTFMGVTARNRIARVDAAGALEAGFNPNANDRVNCVAVQADDRILLGGIFTSVGGITRFRIARVDAAGALDAGFNPNANGGVLSVVVQVDGRILLGGSFTEVGGTTRNRIARVDAAGALEAGFNPNASNTVFSVVVQADGRILLGGVFTFMGVTARNRIARLDAAGALEAGFNPSANHIVASVTVQADGRILLGGFFSAVGVSARNLFARLENDPATQTLSAPDTTQVLWTRGGSSPEVSQTTFELSTNGGSSYTSLGGTATRVGSTANWQLTGLNLPTSGQLRARGRTTSGSQNGGSGLVESVAGFDLDLDLDNDGLLDSWELTYWPSITDRSALDDYDHDGYCELLELALGLNPKISNPGGFPGLSDEGGYLTMTITKQPGATYEVQSAGTLLPSLPDSFSASTTTVLMNDATTLKVRDNTLIGTPPARFMQVKVTAAP